MHPFGIIPCERVRVPRTDKGDNKKKKYNKNTQ
uniref:Uncharacterized protein n=1 Tax=Anopheles quadriannulatus TaxID=34691 RepID=A0A182XQP4_ANOQN